MGVPITDKLDVKSKEYLEWIEKSTALGPITNTDVWGNYSVYTLIPIFYGLVDAYFKENKGDNICVSFGDFYQCYRVKYNGNGYLIGRRSSICADYRIARYRYSEDLVDLEDVQAYAKNNAKVKQKVLS